MTVGSLFSGIGGMDLGLERAGMQIKWMVEIDPFCQQVLAKHWPNVRRYEDVRTVGSHNLSSVDLIVGGFPCQPHSVAGKRRGAEDDRNLWPEFLRVVKELRPTWVLAENVPGIVSLYLDTVLSDLESEGYTCWTFNIPACALGTYHKRARIFVVAHANARLSLQATTPVCSGGDAAELMVQPLADADGRGCAWQGLPVRPRGSHKAAPDPCRNGAVASDPNSKGLEGRGVSWATAYGTGWLPEPALARVVYGLSNGMDKHRVRTLGNAVVPQVAEWIGRQIVATPCGGVRHKEHERGGDQ